MSPEAARFLGKAHRLLVDAETMIRVGLTESAGRTAYLAGFHAAQALIFAATGGRVFKTHNGVQTEFLRLTKDDLRFEPEIRVFLSKSYNLKAIADYETNPDAVVPIELVQESLVLGQRFVALIESILNT